MADRFDKFTERARSVLTLAQEEALRLNHNYIGTEHLLLGLIREGEGVGAKTLTNLGVELSHVRSAVEAIIGCGDRAVTGEIGLTPRAKKVIELAVDEARRLNHTHLGTEHLLLGLIREGVASQVLDSLGVQLDRARLDIAQALRSRGVRAEGAAAVVPPSARSRIETGSADEPVSDPFDKFTERARRALTLAQEEALRLGHNYIGTEHLLLGLVREGEGVAAKVLANLGVELDKVRSAVEFIIGRGAPPIDEIGLTPRAKMVIDFAVDEARRLGHHYIGTEDLLLGLVREGEGIAAGVFESLGVSLDRTREEVGRVLGIHSQEPAQIIDGKEIAEQVRAEVKERADRLHERGIIPGLALVLVGDNPSSLSYVRSKGDSAEQAGIYSDMFHFPETADEDTVISRILEINNDNRFHGVLVQLPLPPQLREDRVVGAIDPAKDADGQTAVNGGRLLRGEPCPWPATPAGIVEMLHRSGHPPAGQHVVICGRSNIVGKPLAAILMQKSDRANATVTLCHTGTQDLATHTRQADILIAAMGRAGIITADMVKPGAVVIDVGNNWVEDPTRKSGRRLVGDVDYEAVRQVASAITPVPGGVGPMTIAMLLSNTVWLAEQQAGRG